MSEWSRGGPDQFGVWRPRYLDPLTPDQLSNLTPGEQAEYHKLVILQSPLAFAHAMSGGLYLRWPHLEALSDEIVGMIVEDSCDVLIAELPVRLGKSELMSAWSPCWYQCRFQNKRRVAITTYSKDFAMVWGAKARDLIEEHGPLFGLSLKSDKKSADRFIIMNDGRIGGDVWAAGVGGSLTGKGFHYGVVDDPLKNAEQAFSEQYREKQWEWFRSTFLTRREPGAKIAIPMARWHHDDLAARIKHDDAGMRVRTLHLPAIAQEDDQLGREPGQALCPSRYDETYYDNTRKTIGPFLFSGQYQQNPTPDSGNKFDRSHIRFWKQEHTGEPIYSLDKLDHRDHVALADCSKFSIMDMAGTRGRGSDYTVISTFALTPAGDVLMVDCDRQRVEVAKHLPMALAQYEKHRPVFVGIERSPISLTLIEVARQAGIPVRELRDNRQSKVMRSEVAAAMMEAGRFFLPIAASWTDTAIQELLEFPAGAHDDIVDTISYAAREVTMRLVPHVARREKAADPSSLAEFMMQHKHRLGREKSLTLHPTLGAL